MTVGAQIAEVLTLHQEFGARETWRLAVDLLDQVGISAADAPRARIPASNCRAACASA